LLAQAHKLSVIASISVIRLIAVPLVLLLDGGDLRLVLCGCVLLRLLIRGAIGEASDVFGGELPVPRIPVMPCIGKCKVHHDNNTGERKADQLPEAAVCEPC
jgi:hypothetical protein